MISQVKLYYKQMKEKFEETKTVTLNLEVDPQIQCVLAQRSENGRVMCKKERESFLISRAEKPLKDYQIVKVVKIKMPDDKNPCYAGVTYLQRDQVMLADRINNRVILVNSLYQYIASFAPPGQPWGICVVDHQEVAVALPHQKTLQFLSVTSGSIKPTRKVQTRYECRSVATTGKAKIVVSSAFDDKGKHYWSLINSTREEEMCHLFDCQCDHSTTHVALSSSCTRVYITVFFANSMYCFDMDGRRMYIYNPDSLEYPYGVATDRDDNVYVVGSSSPKIHQVTPDGTPVRIITEGIPRGPIAIFFQQQPGEVSYNLCYCFRF